MPPFRAPLVLATRQISAVLISLMLSMWTSISLPQSSEAFGIDAGTFGATGGMIDCSDSGILVAFAGAGRKLGNCPLYHTDVQANVSGYVARVSVKQQFHNPYKEKIEAVYTFPLPENAAVDEMIMKVGNRVIKGAIKKKEEARQTYETARAQGHVASLLDQERPNIFTQSVANIEPGQNIDIEIKYVNLLKYEDGSFTFAFPTVVGPRFIPGNTTQGRSGFGTAPDTDLVPDASKITPPMVAEGERAGHDISIKLNINAGVPIQTVQSKLHDVDIQRPSANIAQIKLKDRDKIPNKDFVATWKVTADAIQSGYLTHREGNDGFFTLMLIPPKRVTPTTAQPKEMIFLIDCSGSQRGRPIEKAKETMKYILNHMNPSDTFQVITFNSRFTQFSNHPEVASAAMKERAFNFIDPIQAQGGTWMGPAVEKVCELPNDDHRLRIVTFMTDGFVGNDMEILGMIKKYRSSSRWYSFGTGNSVNRFLIDNIAKEGGGEAEYVLLNSSADEVGKKFYDRISSPVLTDIDVAFEGLEVKDVFPKEPADLWAQKPVFITGRYLKPGAGKVILKGYSGGKPYKQELKLDFPAAQAANDVLPSIWARAKVDRLMSEDWQGLQYGTMNKEIQEEIEQTALKYHIMSQFTSFVAVEEDRKTKDGESKTVAVPVETPDGVSMEATSRTNHADPRYPRQRRSSSFGLIQGNSGSGGPAPIAMGMGSGSGYLMQQIAPSPVRASRGGSGSGGGGGSWSAGPTSIVPSTTTGSGMGSHNYGMGRSMSGSTTTNGVTTSHGATRGGMGTGSFEHYGHYEPGAWAKKPAAGLTPPPPPAYSSYAEASGPSNYYKVRQSPPVMTTPVNGTLLSRGPSSYGGGLPPTNMGKFVHQAGDNQYGGEAQTSLRLNKSQLDKVRHYNAPREVQVIDERPVARDFREAPSAGYSGSAESLELPMPSPVKASRAHTNEKKERAQKDQDNEKAAKSGQESGVQSKQAEPQSKQVEQGEKIEAKLKGLIENAKKKKYSHTQKLRVKIELAQSGSDLLDQLNKAGLHIVKREGRFVIGLIEINQIEKLAELADILHILLD